MVNWIYGELMMNSFLETKKAIKIRQEHPGKVDSEVWIPKTAIIGFELLKIQAYDGKDITGKVYIHEWFVEQISKVSFPEIYRLNKMPSEWQDATIPPPTRLP